MMFRKDIEPRCEYCKHSQPLDDRQVACGKHGVVSAYSSCRSFSYDPLRRVPPRQPALRKSFTEDDMKL